MGNEIQVFKNNELGDVRTIKMKGTVWFAAIDVAKILEYTDTNAMTRRLDDDELYTCTDISSGQRRKIIIINESGLYSSIVGSQKPKAKKFKKWVTSEVLPAVRSHGGYIADTAMFVDSYFPEMREGARELFIQTLDSKKILLKENKRLIGMRQALEADNNYLVEKNMRLIPKAEFCDAVTESKDAIEMSRVAKILNFKGMGRTNLFSFLRANDVLRYNNEPYQVNIDNGWFRTVEQRYAEENGEVHINIKTLVFQKGVNQIRKLLINAGYKKMTHGKVK